MHWLLITQNLLNTISHKAELNSDFRYKFELPALQEIFDDDPELLFSLRSDCAISYILSLDNKEIPLMRKQDITDNFNDTVRFLKISTPETRKYDSDILILLETLKYRMPFIEYNTQHYVKNEISYKHTVNEAVNDYNGYQNCQSIMKNIYYAPNDHVDKYAVNYCWNHMTPDYEYQGYLPAAGQLNIINKHKKMLNYIVKSFSPEYTFYICCWTSTEFSNNTVWTVDCDDFVQTLKSHKGSVFPLFKRLY